MRSISVYTAITGKYEKPLLTGVTTLALMLPKLILIEIIYLP